MDQKKRDNIRALSDREKAREKLPIFYGSFDNFYHGFKEILNNSVDEILNNFDKGTISIVLSDDNKTISVKDTVLDTIIFEIPIHAKTIPINIISIHLFIFALFLNHLKNPFITPN